jgi:hypothetical protein
MGCWGGGHIQLVTEPKIFAATQFTEKALSFQWRGSGGVTVPKTQIQSHNMYNKNSCLSMHLYAYSYFWSTELPKIWTA